MTKSVSTALFCVALICFALPWHGVAVGDATFGGVSGIHLVTGKTSSERGWLGMETRRKVDADPLAVLCFMVVLGGAAAGFVKERKGLFWSAAAGVAAVVVLFMLQWKLGREARGIAESDLRFGFYLALLLSAGAAGLNLYAMMVLRGAGEIGDELAERKAFCGGCGAANDEDDRFCRSCGAPLDGR